MLLWLLLFSSASVLLLLPLSSYFQSRYNALWLTELKTLITDYFFLFFLLLFIFCCGCLSGKKKRRRKAQFVQVWVPVGSPSRGGNVAVYVFDINQPSLPVPFFFFLNYYYVFVSKSIFIGFSTVFHSKILPSTLRFLTLFFWSYSASLVLPTIYLFFFYLFFL